MAFSMRFFARRPSERADWVRALGRAGVWCLWCLLAPCAWAEAPAGATANNPHELTLERTADALYLAARLQVTPGPALEEVLNKGIPVHFVWRAEVFQPRWYWTDKVLGETVRTVRVAYQPLTGRWRVSTATGLPGNMGLQFAFHQNHDTLQDAWASAVRVSRWKLADAAQLDGTGWEVSFRFALDLTLLPRPFQMGVTKHSDWDIRVLSTLPVPDTITPGVSE